jgi:hypothetical protein
MTGSASGVESPQICKCFPDKMRETALSQSSLRRYFHVRALPQSMGQGHAGEPQKSDLGYRPPAYQ